MRATLMSRMALPQLALVAACGALLVFGVTYILREPIQHEAAPEANAVAPAPPVSAPALPSASSDRSESPAAALPAAQAEANALADELGASPPPPDSGGSKPSFDVARIEQDGEAVIAGRAAPGATVELLRNDEQLDQAVADKSGQFVMVPSRLPSGDYELTLRSRLPDGTLATSQQGVKVALAEAEPASGADRSRPEVPSDVTGVTATNPASQDQAARSSQASLLPDSSSHVAKPQHAAASQLSSLKTDGRQSDGASSSATAPPRIATSVVSRGDSLWRISRSTYGVGTLYALVYKANRDRIRNPNLIYPGQIFVLPKKTQ
ncbi:MAG TPA: LysM peptidoglycan-binding domain-containing protein [Bradyrhizobium sp.]|nr:LysM peptidoglycan-binding domain-containing protein [Bradyrhizobium sp.]